VPGCPRPRRAADRRTGTLITPQRRVLVLGTTVGPAGQERATTEAVTHQHTTAPSRPQ
jgi:hypothetical protein